jgi:glycosyltransferase involved in cell wall biosynthesis
LGPPPALATARPLRVIHIGQSFVRAGIETCLKGLIRFLDPRRVQIVRCLVTPTQNYDPQVAAELGVPVELGGRERVRQAAHEADILLCWGPRELGTWLADCRPPLCVFQAHGEGPWTRWILEGCASILDHVIAVSGRVKESLGAGFPVTVIPNGVDTAHLARSRSRAQVRTALGFGPEDFVLGYVGRFSQEKRPQRVIDAVARLPRTYKALLVGWGPLYGSLLQEANDRIPGRYAFVTAAHDVGDYYAAMDALCLLSVEEGFAMVILEAMFCERPVIVTPVGCAPEVIRDRVIGLIVSGTPDSVCAAVEQLHDHPHWARGVAAEGRAYAEQEGHARTMARRYEDLLVRLWQQKFGAERPA